MPFVRANDGETEVYLTGVDHVTTAHDAARALWESIHKQAKYLGGSASLRTPQDGEWGFLVRWDGGPVQWADAYVVSEGASAPGFTATSENGVEVRFVDLD